MVKIIIEAFIKVFTGGFWDWLKGRKENELTSENAALAESLNTVESSHNQEHVAEEAANNAANNNGSVEDADGNLNFDDFNNRS